MKPNAPCILISRSVQRRAALFAALLLAACAQPDDADVVWDSGGSSSISGAGGGSGGTGGVGGTSPMGGDPNPEPEQPPRYLYAVSDVYLFRMDVTTLGPGVVAEKVGAFNIEPDRMIDIAISTDGTLYGVTWSSGDFPNKLWTIDKDTAAATFISEIPGGANVGLTFMADGTLLGADKGGRLFRIDPATGEATDIGAWGNGLGASGDIVGTSDGKLFGFADTGGSASEAINSLVEIDPVTGAAAEVGQTGFDNLWGAAVWCGTFYAFRSDGDLLEIDTTTGKATMLASKIPGTQSGFSGAGVPVSLPGTAGGICP
jgi:hypothetical protein